MDIDKFLHKKGMKPNQTIEVHLNGDKNRVLIIGLKDLLKQYKQALNMHVVGVTLPSYDETNAEIVDGLGLIKTLKDSPFKNATTDEAYTTGFANCYNWLNKKLGN
tara:strand:+ start:1709 stop:2026 length:318 start_codon:yes stop_codon:yes gene_type:complete